MIAEAAQQLELASSKDDMAACIRAWEVVGKVSEGPACCTVDSAGCVRRWCGRGVRPLMLPPYAAMQALQATSASIARQFGGGMPTDQNNGAAAANLQVRPHAQQPG